MHKIALLPIAVLASLAGAAIAQTAEPEPAWRPGALAMVPAGYVAGQAYRTGTLMGGLFQAPSIDAKWTQAARKLGRTLDTDGGPKRILACSGHWGLVESHDGVRGWWRSLCSNQVTNCS